MIHMSRTTLEERHRARLRLHQAPQQPSFCLSKQNTVATHSFARHNDLLHHRNKIRDNTSRRSDGLLRQELWHYIDMSTAGKIHCYSDSVLLSVRGVYYHFIKQIIHIQAWLNPNHIPLTCSCIDLCRFDDKIHHIETPISAILLADQNTRWFSDQSCSIESSLEEAISLAGRSGLENILSFFSCKTPADMTAEEA